MAIAGFCRECPISSTARHVILWMHTILQINSNNRYVSEPGAPILYLNPKNHLYTETKGFIRRVFWEQSRTLEKIGIGRSPFPHSKPCWKHWLKYFIRCFKWVLEFFLSMGFGIFLMGFELFSIFHVTRVFFSHQLCLSHVFQWRDEYFTVKKVKPKHAETLEKIKPKNTE